MSVYRLCFVNEQYEQQNISLILVKLISETVLRLLTQTFEAKINHLETRPSRKPRDGLEDLEYFVQCEVHLSDVSTLVSSIKRIAEDVRTTKEVKCEPCFIP